MKQKISFICIFLILLSKALSKNNLRQVVITKDNAGFQAELSNIVTRNPTISVTHHLDAVPTPQKESNTIEISNSNTSTLPNVGSLGKTAEIIYPHVDFVSKTPISVVSSAPAQIGTRTENTLITSVNKATGKTEQHEITKESPIMGTVNSIDTVYKNDKISYDTMTKSLHQSKPTITTNK